jgi:Ice-binding-like
MKLLKNAAIVSPMLVLFVLLPSAAYAATSPSLGMASTFGILSGTYTNTAVGTTINGDLGYTTPPAVAPTVNGTTHVADGTYNQAGIDQGTALSALNSQPCTFTFAPGAIDLASDTTHGTVGVYTPGVYCITGAASVGGGGTITLTGSGTYIFRMTGALNTSAKSVVAGNGVSVCDVWWTPGAETTLGANSTFLGTDIDASGITVGNVIVWTGRALAFGGTVSTSRDIITAPTCAATPTPTPTPSATPVPTTPGLPHSGLGSPGNGVPWWSIPVLALGALSILQALRRKA